MHNVQLSNDALNARAQEGLFWSYWQHLFKMYIRLWNVVQNNWVILLRKKLYFRVNITAHVRKPFCAIQEQSWTTFLNSSIYCKNCFFLIIFSLVIIPYYKIVYICMHNHRSYFYFHIPAKAWSLLYLFSRLFNNTVLIK